MPVVIWSHGGAEGKDNPHNSMAEWSIATAEAGYSDRQHRAHTAHDHSRRQLCQALLPPLDDASCQVFKYLNWDRPHDIGAVINELEALARGQLRGQIDVLRIAVGGHSAGSGGALMIGGALRRYSGGPVDLSDPRPIAFLAFSPQQPGSDGFFDSSFDSAEHSWKHIERPALVVTGDGDSTCNPGVEPGSCIGDTPFGRRIAFGRMPIGNKYHLYIHDEQAFHTLFELSTDKCSEPRINVESGEMRATRSRAGSSPQHWHFWTVTCVTTHSPCCGCAVTTSKPRAGTSRSGNSSDQGVLLQVIGACLRW